MKLLTEWLQRTTGIPVDLSGKLFTSILIVFVLWLAHRLALRQIWRRTEDYRLRYQWRKVSTYVAFGLALLLLGRVWLEEFQSVVTVVGLMSAGLAIALKDPLVNVAGWVFVMWRRPFGLGDRIQIGAHAGDVVDIRLFQFTIMEIGNWVHADQNTGRIIHLPNGKVFTEPQINFSRGWFDYIWNEVGVLITFESDWRKAKSVLEEIAATFAGHLSSFASGKMKESSQEFMVFSPTLEPEIYTSVEESGVLLTVRFLCEPRQRRTTTCKVWEEVLIRFASLDDVDLAYPTVRYFDNTLEGKPGAAARRGSDGVPVPSGSFDITPPATTL